MAKKKKDPSEPPKKRGRPPKTKPADVPETAKDFDVPEDKEPKQSFIPGAEPGGIPEIDEAARARYTAQKAWQKAAKKFGEVNTALINVMDKYKTDSYETADGLLVERMTKDKVTCKPRGKESED